MALKKSTDDKKIISITTELTASTSYSKIYKEVGVTLSKADKIRILRSIAIALDSNPAEILKLAREHTASFER